MGNSIIPVVPRAGPSNAQRRCRPSQLTCSASLEPRRRSLGKSSTWISTHRSTSRPVSLSRSKSSLMPASGDSRRNCNRLLGWRDLAISSLNCSSGIIMTPSLPSRVISGGPSVRASLKTSLDHALAVCSCQVRFASPNPFLLAGAVRGRSFLISLGRRLSPLLYLVGQASHNKPAGVAHQEPQNRLSVESALEARRKGKDKVARRPAGQESIGARLGPRP
jgi:hypothetical protein